MTHTPLVLSTLFENPDLHPSVLYILPGVEMVKNVAENSIMKACSLGGDSTILIL